MTLFSGISIISLFFVLNSIGNIPLFLAILAPFELKRQRFIILREFFFAFIILLIFNFFGQEALKAIGISPPVIGIAGGAVLFLIAITMIFPHHDKRKATRQEPMIVPLATPITAGPGTITAVMIFSHQAPLSFFRDRGYCDCFDSISLCYFGRIKPQAPPWSQGIDRH